MSPVQRREMKCREHPPQLDSLSRQIPHSLEQHISQRAEVAHKVGLLKHRDDAAANVSNLGPAGATQLHTLNPRTPLRQVP